MVFRLEFPEIPDRTVADSEVEGEVRRLRGAVRVVVEQLEALKARTLQRAGPEEAALDMGVTLSKGGHGRGSAAGRFAP